MSIAKLPTQIGSWQMANLAQCSLLIKTKSLVFNQMINLKTPAQQGAPLMMKVATIEATSNVNSSNFQTQIGTWQMSNL